MLINCFFKFLGFKSPGAAFACVDDVVVGADEIQAFGPGDVGVHDVVVDVVDVGANAVLHGGFTFTGNFAAFFEGCRVVDAGVFEFPSIFWMGFADVDDEELYLLVIGIVEIAEADRLLYKRWSREAAKDECDRFFCA